MTVALVEAARTPHGSFLGGLADVPAVDLGRTALEGLLDRVPFDTGDVDWVGLGNAIQAGVGQVPTRQAVVESGMPDGTPATTINEASGSGLRAIALGVDRVEAGRATVAVAGGMESMSNAPYLLEDMRTGRRHGNGTVVDAMIYDSLWDVNYDAHMGTLTEALVDRFDVSREAQDEYALRSHRRASRAIEEGVFEPELLGVETPDGVLRTDEGPRSDTSMEVLEDLQPSFGGTITPGNASDLSDGAGCVLLADADRAVAEGVEPLAHVTDYVAAYRDPKWFNMATADAVEGLLERNDLAVADVDTFELNEAFAAQMVYVGDRLSIPDEKLNPTGGAVSLGHPIGASGGILTTTLAYRMERGDLDRGIVGMSVGGGGGVMAMLEREQGTGE